MCEEACTKSELEVFRPVDVQVAMTDGRWQTYYPLNTLTNTTLLEFIVPPTSNEVIDMNNTSIYIRLKISKTDDTVTKKADVAPVNSFLGAIFRNAELAVNGQLITRSSRDYAYKEHLLRLTQHNMAYGNTSKFQNRLFGFSMSKTERSDWIDGSKWFEMRGKPCIDLFDCDRNLIMGTDLQLKFYLSEPSFYLIDAKKAQYKIEIAEAVLKVRRVTITPSITNEINTTLQTKQAIYPHTRREIQTISVSAGITSFIKENLFRGQLGVRYFFAMVDANAYGGAIESDPFNFEHFDLSEIALFENGQSMSQDPLKVEFKDKVRVIDAYNTFLESLGGIGDNAFTPAIDFDNYCDGNTVFAFTRSPDLTHGLTHLPNQTGNLTLRLNFKNALKKAIVIIALAEFDSRIQLDQYKNIVSDYAV